MAKLSNFSKELELDWLKRIAICKAGGKPQPYQQRNYYYLIRTITWRKYQEGPIKFANFKYDAIYKLEDKYGYSRERLGITAKPDGTLYSRSYGTEMIQYNHELKPLLCAIATEKSGIAESLSQYLLKYGIFVIDTTGNPARYPMQYVNALDVPKFCIEDFDITGCFMAQRFWNEAKAKTISILDIMKQLNVDVKDVIEEDTTGYKNNHLNKLSEEDKSFLFKDGRYWRIEIDTVMKFVKPEVFAKAVLDVLDQEIPIKNMAKVMELGEYIYMPLMPKADRAVVDKLIKASEEGHKENMQDVLSEYEELEQPFEELDLGVLEEEAKNKFEESVGDPQ